MASVVPVTDHFSGAIMQHLHIYGRELQHGMYILPTILQNICITRISLFMGGKSSDRILAP